jgi:hypothetical protein
VDTGSIVVRLHNDFGAVYEQLLRSYLYDRKTDSYKALPLGSNDNFTSSTLHTHVTRTKLRAEQLAKRIDVNPLVWKHDGFAQAERVFFVIEGCIKADAVLSALLRAGEPPAVFSAPSVSLWEATYPADEDNINQGDELADFARQHLLGKLVCIVPDADAHQKHEVMTQALLCRSTLRRLGTNAEIVLPPDDRLDEDIKGVDDYLGKGGGTLDGLIWYQKEPPDADRLHEWLAARQQWRADALRSGVETLQALATHAGDDGACGASIHLLARASASPTGKSGNGGTEPDGPPPPRDPDAARKRLEAKRKRFQRAIPRLVEVGAITSNKPLSIRVEKWRKGQAGWHPERGLHWAEDEVVITVHEELRAPAKRRSVREL